jgi:hypothetical protein
MHRRQPRPTESSAKTFASSSLAKQHTTKSLFSRRREYVSGVANRTPAAQNITVHGVPHLFDPERHVADQSCPASLPAPGRGSSSFRPIGGCIVACRPRTTRLGRPACFRRDRCATFAFSLPQTGFVARAVGAYARLDKERSATAR